MFCRIQYQTSDIEHPTDSSNVCSYVQMLVTWKLSAYSRKTVEDGGYLRSYLIIFRAEPETLNLKIYLQTYH